MPYSARPDAGPSDNRSTLRQHGSKICCPGCGLPFTGRIRPKPTYTLLTCRNRRPGFARTGADRGECWQKALIRPNPDLTCDIVALTDDEFAALWDDRRPVEVVLVAIGITPWRAAA